MMAPAFGKNPARTSSLDVRCLVISMLEGIMFATMTIIGRQLDDTGELAVSASSILALALSSALLTALCYAANRAIRSRLTKSDPRHKLAAERGPARNARTRRACVAFLCLAALIWYLVLYPGVYWYDAPLWYAEWDSPDAIVTSKWSIPYTWAFHALVRFGLDAFGSYETGLAIFSALQGAVVLYAAIRIVGYMSKEFESRIPAVATTAFLGMHPLLAIIEFSTAQDAVFMAMLGLIVVNLLEVLNGPRAVKENPRALVRLSAAILVFCLARNNGLYVMALALPFAAFYEKGLRLALLVALAAPLALYCVYQGPVLHALPVDTSTTMQEMLSIPVQQLARVHSRDGESLAKSEKKAIESYIPKEALKTYETFPSISDQLKMNLDVERILADPVKFAKLYVKLGLKHPGSYLEAMLMSNLGLWCPFKTYPDSRMYHPWVESENATPSQYDASYLDIEGRSVLPAANELLQGAYGRGVEQFAGIPLVGTMSRSAPYLWLLIFATGFCLFARREGNLIVLAPLIGVEITVFLAPVVLFRYVAPVVFCAPLIAATLFNGLGSGRSRSPEDAPLDSLQEQGLHEGHL